MMIEANKVLVVVAHPDDEVLGLGGAVNRLVQEHNVVTECLILGEGITSRSEGRDTKSWSRELEIHKKNIQDAGRTVGYQKIHTHDFPDNRFDGVELLDLVKVIESTKTRFQPDTIITHHGGDTNVDHRRTFDAVITATRPMENEVVKKIFTFETPSSTEWQAFNYPNHFKPNFFFTLKESNVQAKIEAMESYENERREFPHPRSPEALWYLARKRGVEVGKSFAEAFMVIREITE